MLLLLSAGKGVHLNEGHTLYPSLIIHFCEGPRKEDLEKVESCDGVCGTVSSTYCCLFQVQLKEM